ncbi:MAG TPA: hypothetical protein DIW44_08430 [Anaerolineaceae bacterium]|nr:hypothetical protein [Anaerolineaceae bacterium]
MRQIRTFILRLYIDIDQREKTCGNLQALPGRETFSFKNNSELLNLLQKLSNEEVMNLPMNKSQNENKPNFYNENQPVE